MCTDDPEGKGHGLQTQSPEPTQPLLLFLKLSADERGRGENRESFSTSSQEPK